MNRSTRRILAALSLLPPLMLSAPAGFRAAPAEDHRAIYRQGMEQLEAGKFDDAYSSFARARRLDGANRGYTYWHMILSVCLGQNALFAGDHGTALRHLTAAMALKKELTAEQDCDRVTLQRLIDLTREHQQYSKTKPQYVHAIQVLYIMNTDLRDTRDAKGNPFTARGSITESQITDTKRDHRMMKIYVETLSRGRVSLSFDWKTVNTTLTRAVVHAEKNGRTVYRPDFNSTAESLGPILFEGRNKYDTTIFYFNAQNFDVWCFANGVPSIYIPYTWYGQPRGSIGFTMGNTGVVKNSSMISRFNHQWVVFHEFFHVIERMSGGISPQHAYLKDALAQARKNFPGWVPDMNPSWTATEYSWYRYQMLNTVPVRMEQKAAETGLYPPFRNFGFVENSPDRTEEYVFNTYTAAVQDISLDNLKKASELLEEARKLRKEKKNDEFVDKLKEALNHNPCHHRVLSELGWEMVKKQDFTGADRYYGTMAKVFPDPKELFGIAASLLEKGQPSLAAKYFRIAADRPGRNPVYTRWLARALSLAGEHVKAGDTLARIKDNPAMRSPIAHIINTEAGQALYSADNPENEGAPGLAAPRRQEGCRWKIVPSGDQDYVMIVSDYSWKCLEARGENGNHVVRLSGTDTSDTKKWRLVRGSNGLCRIISRISGTPLAVATAEDGKKAGLTLKEGESNQHWEIQELDGALNRMDYELTVGIISGFNGMAVDLYAGKTEDGAAIKLWPKTGNANQQWKVIPSGDPGFVYIVAVKSWKCLSAQRSDDLLRTVQTGITGSDAQKWKMVSRGGGGYLLINKEFNRALEADATKPSSRELRLGAIVESDNQLWRIE